jgi:hypothetical protein
MIVQAAEEPAAGKLETDSRYQTSVPANLPPAYLESGKQPASPE